jgi:hypothetical protein
MMSKNIEYSIYGLVILIVSGLIIFGVTTPVSKPTLLTTKGNCSIYKMYDKGNRIYFTECTNGETMPISGD